MQTTSNSWYRDPRGDNGILSKVQEGDESSLKWVETFDSIQGEGIMMGCPTTFIRLGGCNLNCSWCDTKYAMAEGETKYAYELSKELKKSSRRHVCITGGEPVVQDLVPLIQALKAQMKYVSIETNGTVYPGSYSLRVVDFWSVSPKLSNSGMLNYLRTELLEQFLATNCQLKFVVGNIQDIEEVAALLKRLPVLQAPVIFQPIAYPKDNLLGYVAKLQTLTKLVLDYEELRDYNVRVLPQLHRILWGFERCR